jgi:hypothetical protein
VNICIIVAFNHDLHADAVVESLKRRLTVIRIDPSEFPTLGFCSDSGECEVSDRKFNLTDVIGIYCRIALDYMNFESEKDLIEKFSAREHLAALNGILLNIPSSRWINFPWKEAIAEGKIYPLRMARQLGIQVPSFVVSSKLSHLSEFQQKQGASIVKPLSDMSIAFQNGRFVEVPQMADFDAPYTADFDASQLSGKTPDEKTPTLVQRKIEKLGDVRAVVVDNKIFATYLVSNTPVVDSRLTKDRIEIEFSLPEDIVNKLFVLIHLRLGLRFATADFVHGIDGHLYLVDVNPSGNWLWQQSASDLPISSAISDGLCRPEPQA